jgi:NodT family efflux transporter outer membrane factor (OMF) lipoprotein
VITRDSIELREWWTVFDDPVLDELIEDAFRQNLSLQLTGLRILEARARLGIAEGNRYPQQQSIGGTASTNRISENGPNFNPALDEEYSSYTLGFDAAWEIDFWGRFARGIEAADAELNASFADYDDARISLAAEVARAYVTIRTIETQLRLADENIRLQRESLRIARVRYDNGATSNLDVQQAKTNLASTQASVPAFTSSLRQAMNGLAILLGKAPGERTLPSAEADGIPIAPALIAAGIPTDLLRRRPVRFGKPDLFSRTYFQLEHFQLRPYSQQRARAGCALPADAGELPGNRVARLPGNRGCDGRIRAGAERSSFSRTFSTRH